MRILTFLFSLFILSCDASKQNSKIEFPDQGHLLFEQPALKDSSFPFYPVRHMETIRDSTNDAFYIKKLLEVFNEENISLRGQKKPLLRIIVHPWTAPTYIIRFTEGEVVVKKGNRVDYLNINTENLSPIEENHFQIFKGGFPISRRRKEDSPAGQRFWDSIIKIYPQLLKEEYYEYIMNKAFDPLTSPFTYSTKTLQLGKSDFKDIVDSLNSSGYWQMPIELSCKDMPTDGDQFIVESNSGSRYYVVKFWSCGDKPTMFERTIKKLLQYAGVSAEDYML